MTRAERLRPGGFIGVAFGVVVALCLTAFAVTEEIEVTDLTGIATLEGNAGPAKGAEVYVEAYREGADITGQVILRTKADDQGKFVLRNVPVGYAIVRTYAPGYSAQQAIEVKVGRPDLDLELRWQGDELQLATNQPVYTPNEPPKLVLSGMTRRPSINLSVFAFTDEQIFSNRDTYALTRAIAYNRQWGEKPDAPEPDPLQVIEHKFTSRDIQGKFAEVVSLPQLKEGVYIVRAEVDGLRRHQWINVSKIGLVTKVATDQLMGFVVDIESGEPLAGVPVTIVGPGGRRDLGTTDGEGRVVSQSDDNNGAYVMVARQGQSKAFCMFDQWSDGNDAPAALHVQTDRTIYRPTDTVQFKAFMREPTDYGFRLLDTSTVTVRILDPQGTEIKSENLPVDAMGGFHSSFETLPDTTGSYQIEVQLGNRTFTEWVPIAAYRKPEFKVSVEPMEPYYVAGEQALFKVKATFFTGEPVVGADLTSSAMRAENWAWSPFDDEEFQWWAYDELTYGGELIGEFKARTDENGETVISVPTRRPAANSTNDFTYTLEVTGEDVSGRGFTGTGRVLVTQGGIDLSIAFEDYVVEPNAPVQVRVRGNWHEDGAPAARRRVTIELGEQVWSGNEVRDRIQATQNVVLDQDGQATVTLRPNKGGEFYVKASAPDREGRTVRARDTIWVYDEGIFAGSPAPSIQIVLDKKTYQVGETATAVVRTDKPGGSALVTVEAERILWSKVVLLESATTTVTMPVTDAHRPNASVRVCYIRDKSFAQSSRSLIVDMGRDLLDVRIVPSVKETLPGGQVSYTVTTRDASGRPVSADVCLSVVDEGIYQIREDTSDPLRSFFPNRWSSVGTYYSFPEVYLDGDDKSGQDLDVRTEFKDTAYWAPSLRTDDQGQATVTVTLPDNLTSWRATAVAVSADARAGKGRSNVLARKPVMVRASLPAFMVQDEKQAIGVTVRNETDRAERVQVSFVGSNLNVEGQQTRTLELEPRSTGRLQWVVQAQRPGQAKVHVEARGSSVANSDAFEVEFPVVTNGPTLTTYKAGDTQTTATFSLGKSSTAAAGSLEINVAPTMLSGVLYSLDSLVDYPYGCIEQTMSRFMPAVVVRRLLRDAGIERPDLDAKIDEVATMSLARIRSMQSGSGGFGWFSFDDSDPGMTALVLEGLYWAQESGLDTDPHVRDRAIEWAKSYITARSPINADLSNDARLAYALALHGVSPSIWARLLPDLRAVREDSLALAYIVLALDAARSPATNNDTSLKQNAYKALLALATESEGSISWSSDYWYEPTAVAIQAVLKMEPDKARAGKGLRYLMQVRRGEAWTSTRDTAQIVLAATEYLRGNNELSPSFVARVMVNGKQVGEATFGPSDHASSDTFTVPVSDLREGQNEVQILVQGSGRAYWSAKLVQDVYDPSPRATTSGHGISIKREFFRMEGRRLEDGTLRLMPSKNPVTEARQGEVIRCRITVTSDRERRYVLVTDPALSNARAIEPGDLSEWEWYYWWSSQEFFDDRTAVFMSYLKKGENIVEYSVRAEALGTGIALPATVELMYQPDVRATTPTYRLEVRR